MRNGNSNVASPNQILSLLPTSIYIYACAMTSNVMVAIMIIDRDHKTELNQALSSQVMDKCKQSFSPMQSQYRDYHRCIQYSVRTHIEAELKAKD